jgi:hypothetical protein
MKSDPAVILVTLVILLVFFAGCSIASSPQPTLPSLSSSGIRAVIAGTTDEWSFSLGCYALATGYAYNTGSLPVDNVVIYLTLIYPDGTIRDSMPVYLGMIPPQESRNFQVILDRECGEEYTIGVISLP